MPQTTLIDAAALRDRFDIDPEGYPDPRVTPALRSASKRLRQWAGGTVYDAALVMVNTDPVPDDTTLWELENAEAHLAMHYAILGFNSPITSKGVAVTTTASEGKTITRYLAPKETAELAQQFLELAEEIWRQVQTAAVGQPVPAVVEAAVNSLEGSTRAGSWCEVCKGCHPFGLWCPTWFGGL